jgi:hypothetical protein
MEAFSNRVVQNTVIILISNSDENLTCLCRQPGISRCTEFIRCKELNEI